MLFKSLVPRFFTAIITLAVLLALVWVPSLSLGFTLFVAALSAIGLHEYYRMVQAKAINAPATLCIAAGTGIILSGHLGTLAVVNAALLVATLLCVTALVIGGHYSIAGMATTVFGLVYIGWAGAHFILLQHDAAMGPSAVMVLLVAVILTDTGAYFVGSMFGRHKLAPKVSPAKTWEGAAGGLLLAVVGMAVIYFGCRTFSWPGFPPWTLGAYVAAGLLLSLASQAGDLAESALKRDASVKDSGHVFPGHGGVLDRCDGFLFAGPVLYYMALFY